MKNLPENCGSKEQSEQKKIFEELKQFLTETWPRQKLNLNQWLRYVRRQCAAQCATFGTVKKCDACQWMWDESCNLMLGKDLFSVIAAAKKGQRKPIVRDLLKRTSDPLTESTQHCLVQLIETYKGRFRSNNENWNQHLFLCEMFDQMVRKKNCKMKRETVDCMLDYFSHLLDCELPWMICATICKLETIVLLSGVTSDRVLTLRQKMLQLSKPLKHFTLAKLYSSECNWETYQLAWCTKWSVDNVMTVEERFLSKLPPIKMMSNRLSARGGPTQYFHLVRSQFPIVSGVYYYEAILVTGQKMAFGWATRLSVSSLGRRCAESIGFDGYSGGGVWHNAATPHPVENLSRWKPGDVVGCLIDIPNRQFKFYLNGKLMRYEIERGVHFSEHAYYAAANLKGGDQCYFNFGQHSFQYPPDDLQFTDFHTATQMIEHQYRLAQTEVIIVDRYKFERAYYWFKHETIERGVARFFTDPMQQTFDQLLGNIETDIVAGVAIPDELSLHNEPNESYRGLRFIQSALDVVTLTDRVEVFAAVISEVIRAHIDRMPAYRFLELIYPHLSVHPRARSNHRFTCVVLANVIQYCIRFYNESYIIKSIHAEVFHYLVEVITKNKDDWTQLYALIALEALQLNEHEIQAIKNIKKLTTLREVKKRYLLHNKIAKFLSNNWLGNANRRFKYQLYTCSNYIWNQLLVVEPTVSTMEQRLSDCSEAESPQKATLNPQDTTRYLKLSPDNLSARSDWEWQSVRSTCSVNSYAVYYEVVLVTGGPMCIGWATTRTELSYRQLGMDNFSIGFDGYSGVVWHNGKRLPVKSVANQWNAGDIVGCLIDFATRQFLFFLNGKPVHYGSSLNTDIYFSDHAYHATISLFAHQQCYINLGQSQFEHWPTGVDFCDFTQYLDRLSRAELSGKARNTTNVKLSNVTNTVVSINSKNEIRGNLTMIHQNTTVPVGDCVRDLPIPQKCPVCRNQTSSQLLRFQCCARLLFCRTCSVVFKDCPIHTIAKEPIE